MFGIGYVKANPTTHVIQYKYGQVKREGAGLSFFHWAPTSTIVMVPLASRDIPFAFAEVTADFQNVTLQGQLTYRVADPKKLASLLDYSVGLLGAYASRDPEKLEERLVNAAQVLTRAETERMQLRDVLTGSDAIGARVLEALRSAGNVSMLGVEVLGLSFLSAKPTPDIARALEAGAREEIQRRSDEAIYARRNAAVEQERLIKESELNTQIAVEEKKRAIRETQMAADIAVEEQRAKLIEQKVENDRKDADGRGYALEATLAPLKSMDWKTLTAISDGGGDARNMIALAFRELAENAQRIGELNMSPDLLRTLLAEAEPEKKNGTHKR